MTKDESQNGGHGAPDHERPKRQHKRWKVLLIIVAVNLFIGYWLFGAFPPSLKVSHETTYFTEPLREDGTVDYVAALNERLSDGVTPEKNACVDLLHAFGPEVIKQELKGRMLNKLGLDTFPDEDIHFTSYPEYVVARATAPEDRESQQPVTPLPEDLRGKLSDGLRSIIEENRSIDAKKVARDQLEQATQSPWSADDFPLLAAWLKANEGPLGRVAEAARKPAFYMPVVSPEESIRVLNRDWGDFLPRVRGAARALAARAMLQLNQGNIAEPMRTSLAVRRLGQHFARQVFLIDMLVGTAITGIASDLDAALAEHSVSNPTLIRRHLADLRSLPALPSLERCLNLGERSMALDGIIGSYKQKGVVARKETDWLCTTPKIDPNPGLRHINTYYDRMARAAGLPTFPERHQEMQAVSEAFEPPTEPDAIDKLKPFLMSPGQRAEFTGTLIAKMILNIMMPAMSRAETVRLRAVADQRLTITALGLALYRAEHGGYPEKLTAIVPDHLDELPRDPFDSETIRYKRTESGCVLYCVDANLTNDDGADLMKDDVPEDEGDYVMRLEPEEPGTR